MDDVSTALKWADVAAFQQYLNSIEPSNKFTVEHEAERRIAFLDTNIFWKEWPIIYHVI